jgi:hypothetical protein
MISWKWTIGEPSEKTPIPKYINYNDTRQHAIQQSLEEDMHEPFFLQENIKVTSRDENDERLASREMMFQCGTNPFLQPINNNTNNNYVNDVMTRDMFLKPINTSTDKIKNKTNENN